MKIIQPHHHHHPYHQHYPSNHHQTQHSTLKTDSELEIEPANRITNEKKPLGSK